jgi:hypothetical protein
MLDIAVMVKFVLSCCALREICLLNDDEFDEYVQEGLRDNEEVNDFHDFLPKDKHYRIETTVNCECVFE